MINYLKNQEIPPYLQHKEAIFVGLLDSDGCITWSWNSRDNGFIPSIYITSKANLEFLRFLKDFFGGHLIETNGNWTMKGYKNLKETLLPLLFDDVKNPSTCKLITAKRFDALLMHYICFELLDKKAETREQRTKILLDLRRFLHFGTTTAQARSTESYEKQFRFQLGSSYGAGNVIAESLRKVYNTDLEKIRSNYEQKNQSCLVNPWQALGFFMGDGGLGIVWGTRVISLNCSLSGDGFSSLGLEVYATTMTGFQATRKAHMISGKNASVVMFSGVICFSTFLKPFFEKHKFMLCNKQAVIDLLCDACDWLNDLKTKQMTQIQWSTSDWELLYALIQKTWSSNVTSVGRKFESPSVYRVHLLEQYTANRIRVR